MKKHGRTTTPITPQNLPSTSGPVVDINVESEKRLKKEIATEDVYRDLPLKKKSQDLKEDINTRRPGDDVDPNQSVSQE